LKKYYKRGKKVELSYVVLVFLWVLMIAFIMLLLVRQYAAFQVLHPKKRKKDYKYPSVTFVVPARNEEENIAKCVNSLLAQDYPKNKLKIIVVNDHSTDATEKIVRAIAKKDSRLKLVQARDLPNGWMGKQNGCWTGSKYVKTELVAFVDADTVSSKYLLSTTVPHSKLHSLDLFSISPTLVFSTFWEKFIVPFEFLLYGLMMSPKRNKKASDAFANGQFIMMKKSVYDAVGGHQTTRMSQMEDLDMARLVRSKGYKTDFARAEELMATRMYDGFKATVNGIIRMKAGIFGSVSKTAMASLTAAVVSSLAIALPIWFIVKVPLSLEFNVNNSLFVVVATGSIILFATGVSLTKVFRTPIIYGLLFPFAYIFGLYTAFMSIRKRFKKEYIWKGRVYNH
jgi:chlorobactene glucosyltransferase